VWVALAGVDGLGDDDADEVSRRRRRRRKRRDADLDELEEERGWSDEPQHWTVVADGVEIRLRNSE